MNIKQKYELISRNTQEIITEEALKKLIKEKEHPTVYLGISITGTPHIGYFVPVTKMADFLKAGLHVKLLLADVHGALDNTPWELLEKRYEYYKLIIPLLFEAIDKLKSKFDVKDINVKEVAGTIKGKPHRDIISSNHELVDFLLNYNSK